MIFRILLSREKKFCALKVVKSAPHYTETALDEIKLLKCVSRDWATVCRTVYLHTNQTFLPEYIKSLPNDPYKHLYLGMNAPYHHNHYTKSLQLKRVFPKIKTPFFTSKYYFQPFTGQD